MNRKRLAITIIIAMLVASLLAGCGPSGETPFPKDILNENGGSPADSDDGALNFSEENSDNSENKTSNSGKNIHNDIKVHYIDVGQGDSELVELPNGEKLLIDAGPSPRAVTDYLDGLSVSRIDYVVATHPHSDHIGGMKDVLDEYDIGKMYMPNVVHTSSAFAKTVDEIEDENIPLYTAKAGTTILDKDGIKVQIISPSKEKYDNLNNYSAVVKITYGKTRFLFMGDAEKEVESALNASDVRADVLKVGHHGSKTSSSAQFIKNVSPKHAVISCGEGNSYGHPHGETLKTLSSAGAKVYRTDESGTVVITADNNGNITVNSSPSLYKDTTAPPAASVQTTPSTPAQASQKKEQTVYVTKTGGKYHSAGCQYLSKSKISIPLVDAKGGGYDPCSKCDPTR